MNGGGGGGGSGNGGRRKMSAPLSNRSKDRDEDLSLFREMHKRDKDRVVSLLQPVSDDFESNGNYPLYGMTSAKKGPGLAFLGESDKNDYDWLKTPPATPLFPSLEMETKNNHELVVQRELPIIQPLSRFAGKPEEMEAKQRSIGVDAGRSKTTNPKPKIPARSVTPNGRSSSLFTDQKKNIKTAPIPLISTVNRTSMTELANKSNTIASMSKPLSERDGRFNFLGTNQSKSIQGMNSSSRTTQKSRGVSPLVTSRMPTQFPGFSDETPPNLKTDRSTSASRGRPINQSTQNTIIAPPQKPETSSMRARRQSCSPSITRGRKVAPTSEENTNTMAAQKGSSRMFQKGNGGQILGSRMVDKIINARKSSIEEKETKLKLNGSINEGSGYGRIMPKSSLDMETKRDSVHSRQVGTSMGRKSLSTTYTPSSRSSGGSYRAL
ncbi:hypothetical protein L6452_16771 [Arctium lappa]|uniref:Uncharacterized protein n=1 Tax=Arctium lappa TaxID=4217 RepID=A0ACB9C1J6_ARCLA|nr:hypothetical protein L6452_16771 [Arctium lappa]